MSGVDIAGLVERLRAAPGFPHSAQDYFNLVRRAADALLAQAAELAEARGEVEREERAHLRSIDERDEAARWADKLAQAIGGDAIGEHSNLNNPWAVALDFAQTTTRQRDEALAALKASEERGKRLQSLVAMFNERIERHGNWDDGCFYYGNTSASELQEPLNLARSLLPPRGRER